ncbi:MAG: succinylglutamate desuccinylase/aspartoacylase family protein [Methanobrevibacter sp.]|uniref:succinylglutamate desuccinylase/aspartoacylase domain-containing protein n=1 Tax=Methanobrevibacter sp. TaxID=66852 RepID=UPI0025D6713A|nr:succinylglutamate desuccinylase/aspartoacylase family protein [Methanobrevibacter sp.]MBR6993174.1 succinylglutamate desuccinylase/aspartoacylase family protein [Methanobrevibacter sp.]
MKKRYLMLALIVLICSLSIVSASEDISISNDTLSVNDAIALSEDVNKIADSVNEVTADSSNGDADNGGSDIVANDTNQQNDGVGDENNDVSNNTSDTNSSSGKTPEVPVVVAKAKKVSTSGDVKVVYGNKATYAVKACDKAGKPIANKLVTITIGKNVYTKNTNEKGVATFTFKYNAGNYVIKYSVDKLSGFNTFTVKNKITLTVLKWGIKGDVSKVKLIKKNMPNNAVVKKAVEVTKKGIPLLMFKGGPGKVVFMTAGVHGNELSSQVAAMKMIAHLTKTPVKGTIYIMPFVNVKAIYKKVRYTDKDFNRIASKSGTIPNKIVKLVSKYKCDAYGDFHTTKPGGVPGKNIVMGSKGPAKKSADLTNYIAKYAKVNKRIYKYAGEVYPGAISDNVNKLGIPAVICEVVLPHNTVTSKSVTLSYNMMKYFLKYSSVI